MVGKNHETVAALLEDLIKSRDPERINDPLRRAVLQHDLWLVHDWLLGAQPSSGATKKQIASAQQRLQPLLAKAIARLALTPEEIRKLPDNYASAIQSRAFPSQFDLEHPTTTFLPGDLFDPKGSWVCLRAPKGPVAPRHSRDLTRSVFLVFLRLPGGRNATLKWLQKLQAFDGPDWVEVRARKALKRFGNRIPNPDFPRLPAGTQVALVRQMMVIDNKGEIAITPITQKVQMRVYRESPRLTAQNLLEGFGPSDQRQFDRRRQEFFELQLLRENLFADKQGGFQAISLEDKIPWKTGFGAHLYDELDTYKQLRPVSLLRECIACHRLPGIYSLNSHRDFRTSRPDGPSSVKLSEIARETVAQASILEKKKLRDWKTLHNAIRPK